MNLWIAVIATYCVAQNIGYAALQTWLLRRRQPEPKWLILAVILWAALMISLFLLELAEPVAWKPFIRDWLYLPMAMEMVWNLLLLQLLFPLMILIVLVVRIVNRNRPQRAVSEGGMSRRNFLYLVGFGAAPATALAMGVHGEGTRDDLQVRSFQVPIANLPPELEGFTIAHVSDLHSGIFVGPDRLMNVSDATNDLKTDLIAVTGDLINREMSEFPAALASIQRMESRYGTFLCEGNHDVIPGPCVVAAACFRNRLPMLYNTTTSIPFGGGRLVLGGLSWSRYAAMAWWPSMVRMLFPPRQPGDVRILLAHHPDLFDIAQDSDLVLSGHTHGGQIMCGDIGLARLRFKYWSGLYARDNTTMIVSNGCGDWFPCRIGAPAEISLVRLTKAATT